MSVVVGSRSCQRYLHRVTVLACVAMSSSSESDLLDKVVEASESRVEASQSPSLADLTVQERPFAPSPARMDYVVNSLIGEMIARLERRAHQERIARERRRQKGRLFPGDGEARVTKLIRSLEKRARTYRKRYADLLGCRRQ